MDRGARVGMQRTEVRHLDGGGPLDAPIQELEPSPWATDDNSVLPEREMARLQENALMYRAVSTGLSKKLALLKFAASDGRG